MMIIFLLVGCLTTMSVSRLCSVDARVINDYVAVGGVRIGRGNRNIWRKPAPVYNLIYCI
jgi:hypothetical protein